MLFMMKINNLLIVNKECKDKLKKENCMCQSVLSSFGGNLRLKNLSNKLNISTSQNEKKTSCSHVYTCQFCHH